MIYIQADNLDRTLAHHFDCSCALYGAIDEGLDYRLTTLHEVESGKFDALIRRNLFVGSTDFMTAVFNRIGLTDVRLPANSNRKSEIITLKEAFNRFNAGEQLFIKPVDLKLFTGFVMDGMEHSYVNTLPEDTKVMAYEPFKTRILSEWRLYIHNDKIVDARNYSGDFMTAPSYLYANFVVRNNEGIFPCAYTMDIGILDQYYDSVVIEYNDMWAIGNYGVPNDLYLRMLRDRYFEITKI